MATIQLGGGVASIRGSIGGWVFSRNAGGDYIRNRAIPVQPGSVFQNAVKAIMAQLTNIWSGTLDDVERAAWDAYAAAVELPNSQGIYRNVGGLAMYIRGNLPRLQASVTSFPRVDVGPTEFTLGDYTAPDVTLASEAAQTVGVAFDPLDGWANNDEAGMLIYLSRPQNPAVNFFKGPYRFAGKIDGDSITPPTSPATIDSPFPIVEGQKLFFRANVTQADGRLGSEFRGSTPVIA
jgi:hypothetical protein